MDRRRRAYGWIGFALALGVLGGVPVLGGCTTNPATGGQDFTPFMTPAQESQIGAEAHPKILKAYGGAYNDVALGAYVAGVTARIAKNSDQPGIPYTVTVLDTPVVNAFALPGGYVYVTRGLLALANDEAELAGVIGHEIGHVAARHSAQRQSAAIGTSILSTILGAAIGSSSAAQALNLGGQGLLASYTREQEYEADMLGVRYLARAGYDGFAQGDFLISLAAESDLQARLTNRQGAAQADWLSSHPATADRVAAARAHAVKVGAAPGGGERNAAAYYRAIDGMIYGDSPAAGFIRDRTFLHPEQRFAFRVPASFRLVNSPSAVWAQGPDKTIVKFDGAKKAAGRDIAAYLVEDWGGKVGLDGVERLSVNGMPAATATTRLQNMTARLVAVEFTPEQVYRFLIGTPPDVGQRYDAALRDMVMSFRRLSVREAREAKPLRVRVVTVRRGDTAATLAERMAFADHRTERFRVLNGLQLGAGAELASGQTVKIVSE